MLNNLNQPKGSTIGVLKDGRTIQEAIDDISSRAYTISPLEFGAKGDGVTLDDVAFTAMFSEISKRSSKSIIDGQGLTYKLTNGIVLDVYKACIRNAKLDFSSVTSSTPFYMIDLQSSSTGSEPETDRRVSNNSNLILVGPAYRTDAPIHGVRVSPLLSVAGVTFDDVYFRDLNAATVWGSNAYLVTFNRPRFHRVNVAFTTTADTEGATSLTNRGENIRFNDGVFDSMHKIMDVKMGAWEVRYQNCSFDFTGRTATEKYTQFYLGTEACILNMEGCHFESGNVNSGWYSYGFHTDGPSIVNINGGTIRFVSTERNNITEFFHDTSGLASFNIEDTVVNGWGIQKWNNQGLRKWRPQLKGLTSQFTLHTTDDVILLDPNDNRGVDLVVRGLETSTYTSKYDNDRISAELSSVTRSDGTVIPSFKITKKVEAGMLCDVLIKVRRPVIANHNNRMGGKILFVPGPHQQSARVITASTGSLSVGREGAFGIPWGYRSTTATSEQLSLLDPSPWYEINTSWGANMSNAFKGFTHDMIRLDLSALARADVIHVFNLTWHGAF